MSESRLEDLKKFRVKAVTRKGNVVRGTLKNLWNFDEICVLQEECEVTLKLENLRSVEIVLKEEKKEK